MQHFHFASNQLVLSFHRVFGTEILHSSFVFSRLVIRTAGKYVATPSNSITVNGSGIVHYVQSLHHITFACFRNERKDNNVIDKQNIQ